MIIPWEKMLTAITAILVAIIGLYQAFRIERKNRNNEILKTQGFHFFLPFKYASLEFLDRIKHIENRLSDDGKVENMSKHENMKMRLKTKEVYSKEVEWFFNDEVGPDGGYFITSTVYMTCVLFYWMRKIQNEYPFIPLSLNKKLSEILESGSSQMHRCKNAEYKEIKGSAFEKKNVDIDSFIKKIKVSIGLADGIPYGLQDSLGDFLSKDSGILNYREFVDLLRDEKSSVNFSPAINYWNNLVNTSGKINETRLNKLRKLIPVITLIESAEIRKL